MVNQVLSNKSEQKLEDQITNTGYTIGELLDLMIENDQKFKELVGKNRVLKIEAEEVSDGKGYLSFVYRIYFHFEDLTIEPCSVIMKIPTDLLMKAIHQSVDSSPEEMQQEWERAKNMHNIECQAYTLFQHNKTLPLPKVYFKVQLEDDQKAIILMEDLKQRGVQQEICNGANKAQCFNVLKLVVEFHAYTKSLAPELYKDKFFDNFHTMDDLNGVWKNVMRKIVPSYDAESQKKARKFLDLDLAALCRHIIIDLPKQYKAETLIHGDVWINNILFQKDETRENGIGDNVAAIFDLQAMFEANPMLDLTRFVVGCVDGIVRKSIEEKLVNDYYDLMTEQLQKLGRKLEYSRETAHKLYKLCVFQQVPLIIIMSGVVLSPRQQSENGHAEKIANFSKRVIMAIDDGIEIGNEFGLFEKFKI